MSGKPTTGSSSILSEKRVVDIEYPKPITVNLHDGEHQLFPMPNRILCLVSGKIAEVVALMEGFFSIGAENLSTEDLLPILPSLAEVLIPNATAIVAASLRVEEQWVEDLPVAVRIHLLQLVLEAEDIPLIVKKAKSLTGIFQEAFSAPAAADKDQAEIRTLAPQVPALTPSEG